MLPRIGLSVAIWLGLAGALQAQDRPPDETRSIGQQGGARQFVLSRPRSTICAGPRPVFVLLHGLRRTGSRTRSWGYEAVADREGFIVAYPQGIDGSWSYGRPLTDRSMPRIGHGDVDDIGFLGRLVDTLVSEQLA